MDFQIKCDKRQTTDNKGFTLPTKRTGRTSRSSTQRDEIKSYWNRKDFDDQKTPDPLIPNLKTLDLIQNLVQKHKIPSKVLYRHDTIA